MQDEVDNQLVGQLAQLLLSLNLSISTAESCTGGGIGYSLTSLAGSSRWYLGGFITYSNAAKVRDLQVSEETLNIYGAVSEQVAEQMAYGCLQRAETDLALAVTGVAGPEGGTKDKPVGTVCFAWAMPGKTLTETLIFTGDRASVRRQTIEQALRQSINLLNEISHQG